MWLCRLGFPFSCQVYDCIPNANSQSQKYILVYLDSHSSLISALKVIQNQILHIAMIHYDTCILIVILLECACRTECVDIKACFSTFLRACIPYAIECSLDVPVCHIVAFYLAAHYHVPLVSLSVLELKAFSC